MTVSLIKFLYPTLIASPFVPEISGKAASPAVLERMKALKTVSCPDDGNGEPPPLVGLANDGDDDGASEDMSMGTLVPNNAT